ncbi:MAG: SDR family oxidoreductase, partial [Mucilaginibacter polytrichastri]|nr:SDR family oxidoreductase [Mucilaginibacter polytrichastri]
GETEDVANACVFLASDNSAYITGQVLSVCGGML